MTPGILTATYIMAKKQKNKKPDISQLKENIVQTRQNVPEHVDWKLCADTVDSLHEWIDELCLENYNLKMLLRQVIERLREDNAQTKKILETIEPRFKKIDPDSTDSNKG